MAPPSLQSSPGESPRRRFPEVVRLRHFVILPALAMGTVILLGRLLEYALAERLGPAGTEIFQASRTVVIAVLMASLIAWLAVRYRTHYERELQARNKELEETRDFLSGIIRDSAEGIVTLDADDRITSWNRAAERIFGWRTDEVVGMDVSRMIPDDPSILEERRRVGERLRAGETVRDHETTRVRKDGKPIAARISWSPLHDASGKHVGSTGIVLDVTAQREMREQLVARERLAAVGEMAAHVAHEVRNPLAGVRAACEVLFTKDDAAEEAKEIGHEVLHQIDRLDETVSELLQFAAPRKIEAVATDLNGLIDRVIAIFREHPASREVRLARRFANDLPSVEIDPRQFEQVLYNLLLNAAQAIEQDGSVVVSTRHDDACVEIRVRDTGPGLPPEAREKLFQPFFTTRADGTGLGLAVAKKIVAAHGGTIEASNAAAGGAEFRIKLAIPTRGA
jgi:two-component system sensor histidine kinase HydH